MDDTLSDVVLCLTSVDIATPSTIEGKTKEDYTAVIRDGDIQWDANQAMNKEATESTQPLQPRKFDPIVYSEGSQRLNIDVKLYRQGTGVISE
eukprot:15138306-Ditylum_brightwellii.AAC.1